MANKLFLYQIDPEYCRYLGREDPNISHNWQEKIRRPFVGIVLSIQGLQYFAPLTSPKSKHKKMKNQLDFLKIDSGKLGAINLNNMIPAPDSCVREVDLIIRDKDDKETVQYKYLLRDQLNWCNKQAEAIQTKARKLRVYCEQNRLPASIAKRCCNFLKDEGLCLEYKKETNS